MSVFDRPTTNTNGATNGHVEEDEPVGRMFHEMSASAENVDDGALEVLLEQVRDELSKPTSNPHLLASYLQEMGVRLHVDIPIRIVVGVEKAGKSRYVEFLMDGLPIGFSATARATVQPIIYMLRYRANIPSSGCYAADGTELPNYIAAVKKSSKEPKWQTVPIGSLAHTIRDSQIAIANDRARLSKDWMVVSITTNNPACEPIIVVDTPGLVTASLDGNPNSKAELRTISQRLLRIHKGFCRVVVVAHGLSLPNTFPVFQTGPDDFDILQYDTPTGPSALSFVH